ncbi:MAG: hypothetical protein IIZ09_14080 [Ruminococcus sp.]|nr:hypothetical protein [Ruminococcus sp.]
MDITRLALGWIDELDLYRYKLERAYKGKNSCWIHAIEYELDRVRWIEAYRKVSQLCNTIGGDVLKRFEEMFPNGINSFVAKDGD